MSAVQFAQWVRDCVHENAPDHSTQVVEVGKLREAAATIEALVRDSNHLLDIIEAQGRGQTLAPKRETIDDANSRDEHDQVFGDAFVRLRDTIAKAEGGR